MEKLYLATSKPRKQFKKLLGQSNHFLITALIGLDYIKKMMYHYLTILVHHGTLKIK